MQRRLKSAFLGTLLVLILLAACQPAARIPMATVEQIPTVSMNGLDFRAAHPQQYRILVAGHIYGAHDDQASHPAATLLQHIPDLQTMNLDMIALLGDTAPHTTEQDFDKLETLFLRSFAVPIFNTVGNHDVENRSLYTDRFGPTYYAFRRGPAYLIFLDTELVSCKVTGEQRALLDEAIRLALADDRVKNILIFTHKTIFMLDEVLNKSKSKVAMPNEWACYRESNYNDLRQQTLLSAAQKKPIYLFAGDVGAWDGNLSPYYQEDAGGPLYTIATGIGDTPQDSVILVDVQGDRVDFQVYSLTGQTMQPLESYNLEYWRTIAAQK